MEQEINSTFQIVNNNQNPVIEENNNDEKLNEAKIQTENFVSGLPDWDLTPPYEVIRRVNR